MLELLVLAGLILLFVIIQLLLRLSRDFRALATILTAQARISQQLARESVPTQVPAPPPMEPPPFDPPSTKGRCHRCSEEIPSFVLECPHCGAPRPIVSPSHPPDRHNESW